MRATGLTVFALLLFCSTAHGQVNRWLQDTAGRAAGRAAVQQIVERSAEEIARDIANGNPNSNRQPAKAPATPQRTTQGAEMGRAVSDFVPGDKIIFYNDVSRERIGEFPSQWDLLGGSAEIASINGENAILLVGSTELTPLMKTPKNYLPEVFTLEFDFYVPETAGWSWTFCLRAPGGKEDIIQFYWDVAARKNRSINTRWTTTSGDRRNSSVEIDLSRVGWHRLSLSFNQRALKIYVDGERVANAPDVAQPGWFATYTSGSAAKTGTYLRNVRIAEGAAPLGERVASGPSQTGKETKETEAQPSQPGSQTVKDITGNVDQFFRDAKWPALKKEDAAQDIYKVVLNDRPYDLVYLVRKKEEQLVVFAVFREKVAESHRVAVNEYLTQVNFDKLNIGNFQMDFSDGEIHFRAAIDVKHGVINPEIVKQLTFEYAIGVTDKFLPGIKEVENGSTPEEVLDGISD
ncbi:MAG: hypothetical protein FWC43_13610 [Planctomycetaceae bacterium]|nr:hypothetical protein [Planctomycetaceae bacterium]